MRLRYAQGALLDLDDIYVQIGGDSARSAAKTVARLEAACEDLPPLPGMGRSGRYPGTQEWVRVRM